MKITTALHLFEFNEFFVSFGFFHFCSKQTTEIKKEYNLNVDYHICVEKWKIKFPIKIIYRSWCVDMGPFNPKAVASPHGPLLMYKWNRILSFSLKREPHGDFSKIDRFDLPIIYFDESISHDVYWPSIFIIKYLNSETCWAVRTSRT